MKPTAPSIVGVTIASMVSAIGSAQTTETEVIRARPDTLVSGDSFGTSVAVDGDLMVIGTPYSDELGTDIGLAYAYEWRRVDWFLIGAISPPSADDFENFGTSVAVSGDWIAVGAPANDDMGTDAGAVHIFQLKGGAISYVDTLYDLVPDAQNMFGTSVAMDGSTLVVGAPYADGLATNDGSASVFVESGSSWSADDWLPSPFGSSGETTGFSVDVSESCSQGSTILLGAPGAYGLGLVHVYYNDGLAWQSGGSWESQNPATGNLFGYSVAIDGDRAVVGEPGSDELATDGGMAMVLEYIPGIGFVPLGQLEPSTIATSDQLGTSVAISGTDILVGLPRGEGQGVNTGRADLWVVGSTGSLTHSKKYQASDLAGSDLGSVGQAVALTPRVAVVGAPQVDTSTGAAYVFANQRYWLNDAGGNWVDSPNWSGGRIPDYESAIYFGLDATVTVEIDGANAEGDTLTCYAGAVTLRDSTGLGALSIYGTGGVGLHVAADDGATTASLELEDLASYVTGQTYVGGQSAGAGLFSITNSSGQYADILIGTGGDGSMVLSNLSTLAVEGAIQVGATDGGTGLLSLDGSSSISLTSADGVSNDIDLQNGVLEIATGSSITCDIGAFIHRDGLVKGGGILTAPLSINEGRIISNVSSGTGLAMIGTYYQWQEDDFGNILNGLMVIEDLSPGSIGIEVSDEAYLGGGCVVGITDPDALNVADVLDVVTASLTVDEFNVWFVPAVGDDKFLDPSLSLLGPGGGVSLIVQPLGTTFGFHPAGAGEGDSGVPKAMVVDDFNGDLVDDVVIAVGGTNGFIDIWLNDGAGTLCLDSRVSLGDSPGDLVAADFDQDNDLDLATVIPALDIAVVFLNDGTGSFSLGTTLATGNQPEGITAFSLNEDTLPDIAVTNYLDDTLTTYENTSTLMPFGFGAGSTVATVAKPKPVSPGGIGTGTDKDDDLVVGGEEDVGSHDNDGLVSGMGAVEIWDPLGIPVDLAVLDLNGDGFDDIAVTLDGTDSLSVLMNDTVSGFDSAALNNAAAAGGTLLAGDIDDDGDDDLILIEIDSTTSDESIVALRNDSTSLSLGGSGGYSTTMLARATLGATGRGAGSATGLLGAGDINVDGVTDVVQVVPVLDDYQILVQTASSGLPWSPDPCCLGDIDGDGEVGVDDLLALIGAWGACVDPGDCPEDLNGSGTVDVDDLLALIGVFGGC